MRRVAWTFRGEQDAAIEAMQYIAGTVEVKHFGSNSEC
jgi:hypothetical protein